MLFLRLTSVILCVMAFLPGAAHAGVPGLISHRAIYDLSSAPDSSGMIAQMRGIEAIEWERTCDGATLYQRAALRTTYSDGETVDTGITLTSWESADAGKLRFSLKVETNGELVAAADGFAKRAPGGSLQVHYSEPEQEVRDLPADVVLPWQYLRLVMQSIDAGKRGVSHMVLRGETPDTDPARVNTQILSKVSVTDAERAAITDKSGVIGQHAWHLATAIFEDSASEMPTFEVVETMAPNGIRLSAEFHYPDLIIRSKLRMVEPLPPPRCG